MIKNMNHPLIQKVGAAGKAIQKAREEPFDADFTGYDWNSLASTIPEGTTEGWWYITLDKFAFVDAKGNFIKDEDAPNTPGAQPAFFLNCEHNSIVRQMEQVYGLPNSETVLRYVYIFISRRTQRLQLTPPPALSNER